jgi:hypothetical protein
MIDFNDFKPSDIEFFKNKIHEVISSNLDFIMIKTWQHQQFYKRRFMLFDTFEQAENYLYLG